MPAPRKLPDDDTLRVHVFTDGMSRGQIAEKYGVTRQGVAKRLKEMGLGSEARSQLKTGTVNLPWVVSAAHKGDMLMNRLRSLAYRQQDVPLPRADDMLLDTWLVWMDGANSHGLPLAVDYNPVDGFTIVFREEGDENYVRQPPAGAPYARQRAAQ